MKSVVLKENGISNAQKRYRDIARRQYISNGRKGQILGLHKKLVFSDRELRALCQSVALASSGYQTRAAQEYFQRLKACLSAQKRIDKSTKAMKIDVKHLKSQISRVDATEEKLKKIAVSDFKHGEHVMHFRSVVIRLENHLNCERQKENNAKFENGRLQILIRDMCIERIQFNQLWAKIVDGLCMNKKTLVTMTDLAVVAFGKGVEYRKRMNIASKHASMVRDGQINGMSLIMRALRMDKKTYKFVGNKMQRITLKKLDAAEAKRRDESKNHHNKIRDAYKSTIDRVKMKSGQPNVDAIIAKFETYKREHCSQFSYMNHLHGLVMQMNAILIKLETSTREARTKSILRKQKSNDKVVRWYDDTRKQVELENHQKESELKELNATMGRHYQELGSLVDALQCDDILGRSLDKGFENDAVHSHNVAEFLTMMEQCLKEIISFVYYLEWRKSDYELPCEKVVQGVDVVNYHLNESAPQAMVHECPECAMDVEVSGQEDQVPLDVPTIRELMISKAMSPEMAYRMHNTSQCNLMASRSLLAKSLR